MRALAVCAGLLLLPGLAAAQVAGPDAYGYTSAVATYDFQDLSAAGTALTLADDGEATIPLTRGFPFYGVVYTAVQVGANGGLLFGPGGVDPTNVCLPATSADPPDIAPYWDDLDPSQGGSVYWLDDSNSERTIVSWQDVAPFNGNGAVSFQVHLYDDGRIQFHWEDTDVGAGSLDEGASATLGIQDFTGGTAASGNSVQLSCDTAGVAVDGTAVQLCDSIDKDGDGVSMCAGDCDDTEVAAYPGNVEQCDGIDNDCNGAADFSGGGLSETDFDGDGWSSCTGDCTEVNPAINPGAAEICDGSDTDCDGLDLNGATWVAASETDADGDGYSECWSCDPASCTAYFDCNDSVDTVNSAATEVCDGYDTDCDGALPASESTDTDGDGDPQCSDCDDFDSSRSTLLTEVCNGNDDDCDITVDEGFDLDGDGAFDGADPGCAAAYGAAADCDDSEPASFPGNAEVCDGLDNDCAGGADYTEPAAGDDDDSAAGDDDDDSCAGDDDDSAVVIAGDLDETDADADGYLGCDDDCDDSDATVYPGAPVVCDDVDTDCDGDPADGFSDNDFDGTLDCVEPDADADGWCKDPSELPAGVSATDCECPNGFGDCDDLDATVHPGMDEICESGDQVDTDCDGDANVDKDGDALIGTTLTYFVDEDGDGFGDGSGIVVCENPYPDGCTENAGPFDLCLVAQGGDCDDSNPTRYPGAAEVCNFVDEDCDGIADDADDLDPLTSGCRDMFRDLDGDGIGESSETLCLCLLGDATSVEEDGVDYVLVAGDCDDQDADTHPAWQVGSISSQAAPETQDGRDNDCNGLIPAVELDCDDDGSLPDLPRIGTEELTAEEAGLRPCDPTAGETTDLTCFDGEDVTLECDEVTLLWSLRYGDSDDNYGGRFDGGRRIYAELSSCADLGDCDDRCAARCAGTTEICDGIDNDCSGVVYGSDEDEPEFPPSMLTSVTATGTLEPAESDLDLDGYLDCDSFQQDDAYEFMRSSAGCADQITDEALLSDCAPMCAFAYAGATEACNGFVDECSAGSEGNDEDRDGHRTCGAWGTLEGSELGEEIFVVVWVDESADAGDLEPRVVPLVMPRLQLCDPEAEGSGTCVMPCDQELAFALDWLLGVEAGEDSAVEALLAVGDETSTASELVRRICYTPTDEDDRPEHTQGGTCTVLRLGLAEAADESIGAALEALVDGAQSNGELPAEATYGRDGTPRDRMTTCLDHPEQYVLRPLWSRERVLEARESVTEWECIRLYEDVERCADIEEYSRIRDQWNTRVSGAPELRGQTYWPAELRHHDPADVPDGAMMRCWGDPTAGSIGDDTGGDCNDTEDGATGAHRDLAEGPWDHRAVFDRLQYGEEASPLVCDLCIDGVDNNCDGLTDCEDPSCAPCFVGVGGGCYGAGSPCGVGGCESELVAAHEPGAGGLIGLLLSGVVLGFSRRRSRR